MSSKNYKTLTIAIVLLIVTVVEQTNTAEFSISFLMLAVYGLLLYFYVFTLVGAFTTTKDLMEFEWYEWTILVGVFLLTFTFECICCGFCFTDDIRDDAEFCFCFQMVLLFHTLTWIFGILNNNLVFNFQWMGEVFGICCFSLCLCCQLQNP